MSAHLAKYVFALLVSAALVTWVLYAISVAGPVTAKRRAAIVFWAATAGPIISALFAPRSLTALGAESAGSAASNWIGFATSLVILAGAASLVVKPGRPNWSVGRMALVGGWGMALILAVSGLLSPEPSTARYFLVFMLAVTAVVWGTPSWTTLADWSRVVARAITMGSLASALIAPGWAFIGRAAAGSSPVGSYDRTIFGIPRLVGLTSHPNTLAIAASVALVLELALKDGRRVWRVGALVAAAACIVLAQSNTTYVAVLVAVVVLVVVRRPAARLAATVATTAALIIFMVSPEKLIPSRLTASDYVSSVSGRTQIWQFAIAEWHRHPLIGYGPGLFSRGYLSLYLPPNMQQVTNAHGQFFQTLADSGVIGIICLVLTLTATVRCALIAVQVDGGLSLSLSAAFLVNCLTETALRPVGLVAFPALVTIAMAILAARARRADSGRHSSDGDPEDDVIVGGKPRRRAPRAIVSI